MRKILYMLIGPKGSGKTHIGTLLERETGITFLRVEAIWLGLKPGEDGWVKVTEAIDELFRTRDRVIIESLGAGERFRCFHADLAQRCVTRMIRVHADLATCMARVKGRGPNDHIAVSDDEVGEYNRIAIGVTHEWAAEIDNDGPATAEAILETFRSLEPEIESSPARAPAPGVGQTEW